MVLPTSLTRRWFRPDSIREGSRLFAERDVLCTAEDGDGIEFEIGRRVYILEDDESAPETDRHEDPAGTHDLEAGADCDAYVIIPRSSRDAAWPGRCTCDHDSRSFSCAHVRAAWEFLDSTGARGVADMEGGHWIATSCVPGPRPRGGEECGERADVGGRQQTTDHAAHIPAPRP